jgi:RNA polymerase sigma-70 factor (ECF subfamily)
MTTGTMQPTSTTLLQDLHGTCNEVAWRLFFRRYSPMLLAFAKRFSLSDNDAHDVVQETLLAVHSAFQAQGQAYDRNRGKFKTWLRGIAKHKVRDAQRGQHRAAQVDQLALQTAATGIESDAEIDARFELEWQQHQLSRALEAVASEVEPAMYQAFELYAVHGCSPARVAELLGVTRNVVYISKTRVLRRIRAALARFREEEE